MTTPVKASDSPGKPSGFNYRHLALISGFGLLFALFFYRLGSYPLFDMDEPRYAEAAREMLERGDFITPYFNYELRFDKPVFFYWLVALAYQVFGLSEFSARLFSAVSATLTVGLVYAFGRYWISNRYGIFSALILATSILFVGLARMSITDMTLCLFMTGTTLALFMAVHRNLRWWLVAGTFAGLSVLTKGPVGIVVPGAILLIYTILLGETRRVLLNRWLPLALAICTAIALPWYVMAYLENGQQFIDALFLHNVTRYEGTVSGHHQPIYFYVIVLLAGFLPWTAYLPAAIKRHWLRRDSHTQQVADQDMTYLIPLFCAVWISFIFVFFTIANTKLLTYILPLFPGLALMVGEVWHAESRASMDTRRPAQKWFTIPAWLLVGVTLIVGGLFVVDMESLLPREAKGITSNAYNVYAVGLLVMGSILTAWLLTRKNALPALLSQALTMGLLTVLALHGVIPNISQAAQGVMLKYLQRAQGGPVVLYEIQRPSLTFYGRRRVPRFVEEQRPALLQELNRNQQTFVITRNDYLSQFKELIPTPMQVEILEKGPVYSLLSVNKPPSSPTRNP